MLWGDLVLKAGDIVKIRGVDRLILDVDQYGGYQAVDVADLKKKCKDLKISGKIPAADEALTLIEHWRSQPRLSKIMKIVDAWELANP